MSTLLMILDAGSELVYFVGLKRPLRGAALVYVQGCILGP